jgi:hypothetical protein
LTKEAANELSWPIKSVRVIISSKRPIRFESLIRDVDDDDDDVVVV